MNRPRFVRVISAPWPRASTDIAGIRRRDDVAQTGTILPVEWFGDVSDEAFEYLLDTLQVIEVYEPDTAEMAYLRSQYPTLFPVAAPEITAAAEEKPAEKPAHAARRKSGDE